MDKEKLIENPPHYTERKYEVVEIIEDTLAAQEFTGGLKYNILKYLHRAGKKGDELEDFLKAQWYLRRLIDVLSKRKESQEN